MNPRKVYATYMNPWRGLYLDEFPVNIVMLGSISILLRRIAVYRDVLRLERLHSAFVSIGLC